MAHSGILMLNIDLRILLLLTWTGCATPKSARTLHPFSQRTVQHRRVLKKMQRLVRPSNRSGSGKVSKETISGMFLRWKQWIFLCQFFNNTIFLQFLNIWVLRDYLELDLKIPNPVVKTDIEKLIDDFIFICFLTGNDFIPHIPSVEIHEVQICRQTLIA